MELFGNAKAFLYMALAGLVVFLALYFGKQRKLAIIKSIFNLDNYLNLISANTTKNRGLAQALFLGGLCLLFIALAMPQWGREKVNTMANVSQAVIALDISNSMLAQDFMPSRLAAAKMMIDMLLGSVVNERLGLVAFTSQAYIQCPVTTDYSALKMLTKNLSTSSALVQGTSFTAALNLSVKMLAPYPGRKAIVLISDGEDNDQGDIEGAIKLARDNNISIITVGVGSPEGELIPMKSTDGAIEYKKDRVGNTVLSKLDEKALVSLASATGGAYIRFKNEQEVAEVVANQLLALDKTTAQGALRDKYKDRYQIPLLAGVVLLLCSILIPLRKVK